ncbi:MAG TPA: ABC transporter ATP-binding protein [Quisquiliibacterium sp.]|nr:ABC transporter ATP-binding protein [Quisquiliibacterium sp.]HQD84701.1 ABC transporter ATP-binding protein [Quisquiliibacterium sp.]HQN14152.1 ABC transporter ATP-binding protein [Quisquiliibacterium sp.]
MLELHALRAGYGAVEVLHEVSLRVDAGEIVSLIGPNTAGKSTLLRAISRLGAAWTRGDIVLDDRSLMSSQAHEIAGRGIAHVLEGRHIFPRMTVAENLRLGAWSRRGTQTEADRAARMDRVIALFPRLGERLSQAAGTLSGGEQQMVAVGRALMLEPRLLLLDEPSHGLAPKVVDEMHAALLEINRQGVSILLVEQNAQLALAVSSRAYVLSGGRIELEGPSAQLVQDDHVRSAYLGI